MVEKIKNLLKKNPISIVLVGFVIYFLIYKSGKENEISALERLVEKKRYENIEERKQLILVSEINIKAYKDTLRLLASEIDTLKINYKTKKQKLRTYEKPRYYFDIDSKRADSIITNSRYRHNKENYNLIEEEEN